MTKINDTAAPCPGAQMGFTFYNLTPGQPYTITPEGGLSFTTASPGTDALPGGVTFGENQATFTAPTASVSFALGVAVSSQEVSFSTNLTGSEVVVVNLLSGNTSGQSGQIKFTVLSDPLPPTCIILNPDLPRCSVCAMEISNCPEAATINGSQFCLGKHIYLCCVECPGSPILVDQV